MPFRLKKIKERKAAATRSQQALEADIETNSLLRDLRADLIVLKGFDATAYKIAYKKERINHYLPWVSGLIEGDSGLEDKILQYMLVWSIDIGDITHFLQIANYMEKHQLQPPFETKLPTFVSDNARDNIESLSITDAESIAQFLDGKDVQQNSHATFLRLLGEKILDDKELDDLTTDDISQAEKVSTYWHEAVKLKADIGIKKRLESLDKKLIELKAEPAE
ncbi:phage terminase small subunit [Ignatzschineria rhizosphaerae]|uniref:Phage terminase small subunit n=1 Tax=Ignatzschineria rhizosphaerae TaxID=2923279 RepID=A0ABY3X5H9_9GAMM|nr:phage terminase small subunit [Ignatzschineria rhizosphaerae]UNM96722.1 phage terminase small subunit [Ignatzschineria rhizosphaerae]